ncbi:phosphoribosyltransferase [Peribacillus frigoritolerans]|uniref:phosphoribosyltransferase n=1 Tax=Peribacillus frigoritolerans TaxID=450367 RepID=UPI002E1C237D|nr:phosphoribosyltransferase [Peribacillus frigoritolerans]
MRYPDYIEKKLPDIEKFINKWPVKVNIDNVVQWMLQFEPEDHELPYRVIMNLNVLSFEEINTALEIAFSKLNQRAARSNNKITHKNTLFAGVGPTAKSGSMISYHFRVINDISENNFIEPSTIHLIKNKDVKNIVLVDDVIASGDTVIGEVNKLTELVVPLNPEIKIYVLSICGFRKAIERINEETAAHAFCAYQYSEEDTVVSLDSSFYKSLAYEKRLLLRDKIIEYGKITNKSGLGYRGVGALVVFPYNTPNCTLPIVWGDKNGWIPLFRRAGRISGITGIFDELDKTVQEKKGEASHPTETVNDDPALRSLHMFVEGKTDERFFDYIIARFNIEQRLGYKQVKVISLGGAVFSSRLIETLSIINNDNVFVLDGDWPDKTLSNIKKNMGDYPVYLLKPSILQFLDLKKIFSTQIYQNRLQEFMQYFDDIQNDKNLPDQVAFKIEQIILKGPRMRSQEQFILFIEEFLQVERVEEFIKMLINLLRKN